MRTINEIIVHCTATPAGRRVTVAEIDRWHRARGFRCIGYHYVVDIDGTITEGRPLHEAGAHCRGHNARSIGIAYAGGLDAATLRPADTRTPMQRQAMYQLIKDLKRRYPGATVHGHREFAAKACPCFDAAAEYADL